MEEQRVPQVELGVGSGEEVSHDQDAHHGREDDQPRHPLRVATHPRQQEQGRDEQRGAGREVEGHQCLQPDAGGEAQARLDRVRAAERDRGAGSAEQQARDQRLLERQVRILRPHEHLVLQPDEAGEGQHRVEHALAPGHAGTLVAETGRRPPPSGRVASSSRSATPFP